MMSKPMVETSIVLWGDRHMPGNIIVEQARMIGSSGVVDGVTIPDHMINLIPPSLWTPENTPMASVIRDPDSLHDATVMGTLVHAAAPELLLSFASDPVRKGPADWCQLMWSMASVTGGKVRFQFGPGEAKNLNPYGHKRSQGLARFEDLLRVSGALWEADGPIDYVGHHWQLKQAYLGSAKPHRPAIWSMGTGPKQLDLATTFCDGITAAVPTVWSTPAQARTEIDSLKAALAEKGRDPETIGFGAFCMILCHENPEVVDRALDNPIIRWLSAIVGRLKSPAEFRKDDIEPATPEGWVYFTKFLPYETTPDFAQDVVSKSSRRMAESSFIQGNPFDVAARLREFIDAGLTWVCMLDYTPMILDPADASGSLRRTIEVCRLLKAAPVVDV